jgi:hypothetical protein
MRWPDPTTEEPTPETLTEWSDRHGSGATDGCWLAQDAEACRHGYPSWLVVLGIASPLSGE